MDTNNTNQPSNNWIEALIAQTSIAFTRMEEAPNVDIIEQAQRSVLQGEVRSSIIATLSDILMDIGNNPQRYTFSQETYAACTLCLGAMDVYADYYADGLITLEDILRWVDEALREVSQPGPICTTCMQIAKCGTCPDCQTSTCRTCLIKHLESHDL